MNAANMPSDFPFGVTLRDVSDDLTCPRCCRPVDDEDTECERCGMEIKRDEPDEV